MALLALLMLLLGAMTGLLTGRWQLALPLAAAGLAAGLLADPEAGSLGVLAAAGFLAGAHLHTVVAEQS